MPADDADMGLFSAVEVINYGEIMFSSAKYWDSQLRAGHRLAAMGGSDNHNASIPPGEPGAIGWPVTAIESQELSVPAILDAIRAGRTFVDLTGSRDKMLDFDVTANGVSVKMGRTIHAAAGTTLSVRVHTVAEEGSTVPLFVDGEVSGPAIPIHAQTASQSLTASAGRHWLRLEVHDRDGVKELMSSPLYINFPEE